MGSHCVPGPHRMHTLPGVGVVSLSFAPNLKLEASELPGPLPSSLTVSSHYALPVRFASKYISTGFHACSAIAVY